MKQKQPNPNQPKQLKPTPVPKTALSVMLYQNHSFVFISNTKISCTAHPIDIFEDLY
jgi:hypothetical protein